MLARAHVRAIPLRVNSNSFFLAAALLLSVHAAHAAPAGAQEAEAAFKRANLLVDEGNYEAALVEYRRSLELYPTRAATRNIAVALRKLHRYDEALEAFETFAKKYPPSNKAERATLDAEIAQIRSLVGTLRIECNEKDATVEVDGKTRGMTPLAPFLLAVGTHRIRVAKDGWQPLEKSVDLSAQSQSSVRFDLKRVATTVAPPIAPPSEPRARSPLPALGWAAIGLGAGAAVFGGVALGLREERISAMKDAGCTGTISPAAATRCDELAGAARTRGTLAVVGFVAAGVLVGTGLVLHLAAPKQPKLALRCTPGLGVDCTLRF